MDNLSTSAQQVLDALTEIGQGTTTEIREKTGKSSRVTDKAVKELADANLIVETDPGDGNPARWTLTTGTGTGPTGQDEAADTRHDTGEIPADGVADEQPTADDTTADTGSGDILDDRATHDASGQPAQTADAETADTDAIEEPARPRPADRRVLAVAGVLGDYPDGATVDVIADASGFGVPAVARLLLAMEQADAARRIPADTEAGTPEQWQPGPGKASAVDPNPAPPRCHACGQVIRTPKAQTGSAATARGGASGSVNSDGNEPLGRNVLRGWVLEFIDSHPGHVFTPQTLADELGALHGREISSGAVRNNCTTLAAAGQIALATETPLAFTANPSAEGEDGNQ
jgi:hypothetical protein